MGATKMTTANETSPFHYASDYQHWDLAITIPLAYLEGCATKYVARSRKKHGAQDLQKAMHYLDKLIEVADFKLVRNLTTSEIGVEVNRFALANGLSMTEEEFILALCTYESSADLYNARCILEEIYMEAEIESKRDIVVDFPGTPDDGGHHAS
jgi:hypothetical protein